MSAREEKSPRYSYGTFKKDLIQKRAFSFAVRSIIMYVSSIWSDAQSKSFRPLLNSA